MSAPSIDARPPDRRELLAWAAGLGAVTAEALAVSWPTSLASARGRLAAAERAGTMRAWRQVRDEPTLYTVTRTGLRAAQVAGLRPASVSPGGARHAVACCAAAASLTRAFAGHAVIGEPAVRRAERERGAPFAALDARLRAGGDRPAHRPDLLLISPAHGELPIAVEVELTVKAPERLAAICRAWARSRQVSGVLYLASGEVLGPLSRAVDAVRGGERVVVLALEAIG
jgi:hypothetical protein